MLRLVKLAVTLGWKGNEELCSQGQSGLVLPRLFQHVSLHLLRVQLLGETRAVHFWHPNPPDIFLSSKQTPRARKWVGFITTISPLTAVSCFQAGEIKANH